MEPSEGFEGFVAAYEAGSISGGARELGVPRATLSRQITRLEKRLGVRLVHRDTRRFEPTEAGQTLYTRARRIVVESREAVHSVRRCDGKPRGVLRLSVPPSAESALAQMLIAFSEQFPEVRLQVQATTEHVDLRSGRFDVALRAGVIKDPDLIARVLLRSRSVLVGAPEYLARVGKPEDVGDLAEHRLLVGFAAGAQPARSWPLLDGGDVEVEPHLASNDLGLLREAARAGQGLALIPTLLVNRALESGELETLLEDEIGERSVLALVYPERDYLLPKVRAFVDHVVEWVGSGDFEP